MRRFWEYLSLPDGAAAWLVCRAADAQSLGMVELGRHKDGADTEVSYQFDPAVWGHGYAREAVGAVVAEALCTGALKRVIAETQTANGASCRLLEQLGMVAITRVQRFGAEQVIYAKTARKGPV